MDINLIRSLVTLLSLALFVGLMAWTWWPQRRGAHEAAAQLPFEDELPNGPLPGGPLS
jgi:cytochrome c oxidase cbb3-type subunit 4